MKTTGSALLRLIAGALLVAAFSAHGQTLDLAQAPDDPPLPYTAGWSQPFAVTGSDGMPAWLSFATSYDRRDWSGSLEAFPLVATPAGTEWRPAWSSAARMDAPDFDPARRTVLSHDGARGVAFRWRSLSVAQQAALAAGQGEAAGQRRLDFVRGAHSAEAAQGGPLRDRIRSGDGSRFRQGDMVHARPWFVAGHAGPKDARPAMVYAGGNDGMLHGFDALTGTERLAYVPAGVLPRLREFGEAGWRHRYLVDGHAFAARAGEATMLVGTAGAGAKGYFVLDISQPQNFSEAAAGRIVLADTTQGDDPDIGHMVSEPSTDAGGAVAGQIALLHGGRWAAVLGNGFGSTRQMPVLLLQYLDKGRELRRLAPACPALPAPAAGKARATAWPRRC
ncbi:hypothetical protein GT347_00615 [Xylophilus rhododendri]|uniref:PilY1 beta-propeller domain-containing protein n=1 Tax=Xylophilus rhododendri TaxID=2697032 RepID=A0A857IYJ6_9BURK|nr:PilC/PilY family type IV pilus protein [Xylophilus rhododendri]QHI96630.1 hypothetical protein GT347_00615 [Xylophilus rhododendri]